MCSYSPSEEVRSQSLFSLLQVAHRLNIDPQNLELAQFLHHRLKPKSEAQTPGLPIADPFVELPIKDMAFLLDANEHAVWAVRSRAVREAAIHRHTDGWVSEPGVLTATVSVAEAVARTGVRNGQRVRTRYAHEEEAFRLPPTEALKVIQNHCFKQVAGSPSPGGYGRDG